MEGSSEVLVRRSARHDVAFRGRVCVAPDHASVVRLSAASTARSGWVDVDILDFSAGGIGFLSLAFFPRRCQLRILVTRTDDPAELPMLDVLVRVQRVIMTDRRPAYLIGTAFDCPDQRALEQIDRLLCRLEGRDEDGGYKPEVGNA